jgi:hypothetical protein
MIGTSLSASLREPIVVAKSLGGSRCFIQQGFQAI